MKENLKLSLIEFLTNIVLIVSLTYWINSILVYGFSAKPVGLIVGLMFIFIYLVFRNLNIKNIDELSFRMFKYEQTSAVYIVFMILLVVIDIVFYTLTLFIR